ncbi:short-chain dehydrogenase [Pyronema omphalodes]|nr:short-chain dehydrogenase [Pyronema omphalodes]
MTTPTILITGASRGIGSAIVSHLLSTSSANLFLVSRTAAPMEELKQAHNGRVDYLAVDMAADDASAKIKEALAAAFDGKGRLDALVLNHGVLDPVSKVQDADVREWKMGFMVNFFSGVALTQALLPALRESKGRVIFVSSGAATTAYPAWAMYGSSKAAMNHFCLSLATEVPEITAVSIRPGVVDTQMQKEIRTAHVQAMGEGNQRFQNFHKDGKLLRPDQPGNVIAKLALNMPKEISGQFLSWNSPELAAYQE